MFKQRGKIMSNPAGFALEFHVARQARDRYQFDQTLFASSGNVIFANFHAARLFAQKMNLQRDLVAYPEQAVRAGQINAMGLIDELLHIVVSLYRQQRNPVVMQQALSYLDEHLGHTRVEQTLRLFSEEFPPSSVYRREQSLETYMEGESQLPEGPEGEMVSVPNRQILLEEMLLLWLANENPAFSLFDELFDDTRIEWSSSWSASALTRTGCPAWC
jgi:hypothetical protein